MKTRAATPRLIAILLLTLAIFSGMAQAQSEQDNAANQPEVRSEHQDWIVRCQPAPEGAFGAGELCEMYQGVSESESGQTVFEVVIGYPQGAESPIALFNLPLGMRLPPGVQLQVDENEPVGFAVQICLNSGCRGDIAINETLEAQMRAGAQAVLTIADPQGRGIELPLSLSGFSAALDEIEATRP